MDRNANKPLPQCRAILLCEDVGEDPATGEISLHKLIDGFKISAFPAASKPFWVFVQLYDGIGRYQVSMEANALDDGISVAKAALPSLDFPERLAKIDMMIPVESVILPRPGRYELIALLDGQELCRQHFDAESDDDTE